ncbi:MAG: hypothetical protein HQL55_07160 [Magnetococcales bacterium]|nr:hypothetical protein [Magnetococcales bacterium]
MTLTVELQTTDQEPSPDADEAQPVVGNNNAFPTELLEQIRKRRLGAVASTGETESRDGYDIWAAKADNKILAVNPWQERHAKVPELTATPEQELVNEVGGGQRVVITIQNPESETRMVPTVIYDGDGSGEDGEQPIEDAIPEADAVQEDKEVDATLPIGTNCEEELEEAEISDDGELVQSLEESDQSFAERLKADVLQKLGVEAGEDGVIMMITETPFDAVADQIEAMVEQEENLAEKEQEQGWSKFEDASDQMVEDHAVTLSADVEAGGEVLVDEVNNSSPDLPAKPATIALSMSNAFHKIENLPTQKNPQAAAIAGELSDLLREMQPQKKISERLIESIGETPTVGPTTVPVGTKALASMRTPTPTLAPTPIMRTPVPVAVVPHIQSARAESLRKSVPVEPLGAGVVNLLGDAVGGVAGLFGFKKKASSKKIGKKSVASAQGVPVQSVALPRQKVMVEPLGAGVVNMLGDAVGGVARSGQKAVNLVTCNRATGAGDKKGSPYVQVTKQAIARSGAAVTGGLQAVANGLGLVVKGGVTMVTGTLGCLTGAVVCIGRSVVGGFHPNRTETKISRITESLNTAAGDRT